MRGWGGGDFIEYSSTFIFFCLSLLQPVNIDDLKSHLKNDIISHAMLHNSTVQNIKTDLERHLQKHQKTAAEQEENLKNKMKELKDEMSIFMKKVKEIKKKTKEQYPPFTRRLVC